MTDPNTLNDDLPEDAPPNGTPLPLAQSEQLQEMLRTLGKMRDALQHDTKVTSDDVANLRRGLAEPRFTVGRQSFTEKEVREIPALKRILEVWEEIKQGNYDHISEIVSKTDPEQDIPMIFDCKQEHISHNPDSIDEQTKVYVGPLHEGLFDILAKYNIQHIYTSFPEGRIRFESLDVGFMTAEELVAALDEKDASGKQLFNVSSYGRSMLTNKKQFIDPVNTRYREQKGAIETLDLVRLRVRDLGFTKNPTTTALFKRARELGLELCPPETGPYKRLADRNQPLGDWYRIGMEPITGSDGVPNVFDLEHDGGELWLGSSNAHPDDRWNLGGAFVFRRCKSGT